MQETWVRFLGRGDPLEKEMAIHSSILAWKIPWTEDPGRLQSTGSQESDTTHRLNHQTTTCIIICSEINDINDTRRRKELVYFIINNINIINIYYY